METVAADSLHLYNSATHRVELFEPLNPGRVGIYLCGATVQGSPHLGHMRSALAFDVLIRHLRRSGYQVTYVRNVTDIDDKILRKSAEAGQPWWAWAYRFEQEFAAAYRALNILPPTVEPRATGHITDQLALIARLIERGHAYADGQGNVYFSVVSLPDYGSLTNQKLSDLATTEDESQLDAAVESGKRDPRDFALWKAAKEGEPASAAWDTPWGRGRPGWHLECSAMAQRYLGDAFDIHGGGLDLRFPHHENEQAQSHGAGWGFARYWLHNAWLTMKGEKMSKSLGNSLVVSDLLSRCPAPVVRLAVVGTHYRTNLEYSEASLTQAAALWDRFHGFVTRATAALATSASTTSASATSAVPTRAGGVITSEELAAWPLPAAFVAALNDDLNVPGAMAAVHQALKAGNTALASADMDTLRQELVNLRSMLDILGLDPLDPAWAGTALGAGLPGTAATASADGQNGDQAKGGAGSVAGASTGGNTAPADPTMAALDTLVRGVLEQRAQARAAKDWARADALRDQLTAAGIQVEDSPTGPTWSLS